jgi:mRNA interferase RelE/StbE
MYQIVVKPAARKELSKLSPYIVQQIANKIEKLASDPRPEGSKKLVNSKEKLWRVRIGDHRILYSIDDVVKIVDIYHVGHRRDIYR